MRADRKSKSRKETHTENGIGADSSGKPLLDVITSHPTETISIAVTDLSEPGFYADASQKIVWKAVDGEYGRAVGPERTKAIIDTYHASSLYPNGPLAEDVKAINRLDKAKS
jgi:hypothetical protein